MSSDAEALAIDLPAARPLHRRAARIIGGVLVLILAAIVMPVPGPGATVLVLVALGLLAEDVPIARRIRDKVIEKTRDENGKTSPWVWVIALVGIALSSALSYWWYVVR
jgi:hypothetical protein